LVFWGLNAVARAGVPARAMSLPRVSRVQCLMQACKHCNVSVDCAAVTAAGDRGASWAFRPQNAFVRAVVSDVAALVIVVAPLASLGRAD
jgi:hypothetical protein